jgi:hypothetical protein
VNILLTLGSALLLALFIIGCIRYRNYERFYIYNFKLLIVFSVYIQIGYFINIGGTQFEYADIMTLLMVILGLPLLKNLKIQKKSLLLLICLFLSILVGYLTLIFSPHPPKVLPIGGSWDLVAWGQQHLIDATFSSAHIMRFIRVSLFFLLYCILDNFLLKDSKKVDNIKKFVVNSGLFFVGICFVEQLTKAVIGSTWFLDFSTKIFGIATSQVVVNFERGGVFALQGLTFEPSVLVFSFLPAVFILLTNTIFSRKKQILSLCAFLYVILASGSFGGFAFTGLFIFVYIFSNIKFTLKKLIVLFYIAVPVILVLISSPTISTLLSYYFERVQSLLNNGQVGSETSRMLSVNSALDSIIHYPFFGVGLGSTDIHGFLPTLFASLGIIGGTLWFILMLKGFGASKTKNLGLLLITLPFLYLTGSLRVIYSIHMLLLFLFVFRKYQYNSLDKKMDKETTLRAY